MTAVATGLQGSLREPEGAPLGDSAGVAQGPLMSQLEFFPVTSFVVTATLQLDGTWSMVLGTNLHPERGVAWKRDVYDSLSLGELFDVILTVVY